MGVAGVKPKRRRLDSCELEEPAALGEIGLGCENVSEADVDAEGVTVELASEPRLGAKSVSVVDDALSGDLGHVGVAHDRERQPVTEVERASNAELRQKLVTITDEAEIDVLGGSGAVKPKLEHEAALQDDAVGEVLEYPCEEAVEDEQLAETIDLRARDGAANALLNGHPESLRGSVLTQRHSASRRRVAARPASGYGG